MTKIYQHISCEERAVIMIKDQQGVKGAKILGRDRSSVTRELNYQPKGQYCATKGTDLSVHSQKYLNEFAWILNTSQEKATSIKHRKNFLIKRLMLKLNVLHLQVESKVSPHWIE